MKVLGCLMASHRDRESFVTRNVSRALEIGKVDAVVFVNGGDHRFAIESWPLVHTVHKLWADDFPGQRNCYLRKVDQLQNEWQEDVLLCTFDDDELYSTELWTNIREIGESALEADINNLAIRCHSVTLDREGREIRRTVDDYWKALIIVWEPGIEYVAVTYDGSPARDSFVHEWLIIPSGTRYRRLDNPLHYEHQKTVGEVWFRAARNVWAGGGGKNLGHLNPLWRPFQDLVRKHAPWVQTSKDFEDYLKAGDVAPEVKEAILGFRHLGTPHDSRKDLWPTWEDGTSEWREISLAYFAMHHPSELPREIIEQDRGKIDWVQHIEEVHGIPAPG